MQNDTATAARFTPRELPYAYDALAPQLSEETLHYHHDKHYVGYVNKLNELVIDTPYAGQPLEDIIMTADGAVYNNAAQAWNHEFYFDQLSPKPQSQPQGALLEAIDRSFGSFDRMKTQMNTAAAGLFGSGWVWLAAKPANWSSSARPMPGIPCARGSSRCCVSTCGSMPIMSITATAAPMPSQRCGTASTGKPSASVTTANSRGRYLPLISRL